jgi:hypothetical protein
MSGQDEPTGERERDGLAAVRGFRSSVGGLDQGTSDRIQTRISQHETGGDLRRPAAPAPPIPVDDVSRRRMARGDEVAVPTSPVPRTRSAPRGPQPVPTGEDDEARRQRRGEATAHQTEGGDTGMRGAHTARSPKQ